MNDQYLWDRSGEVDPEVADLERILRPMAYDGRPLDLAAMERQAAGRRLTWRRFVPSLALAAGICLLVAGVWTQPGGSATTWTVERIAGAPRVGGRLVEGPIRFGLGDRLETDARSRARLRVAGLGTVELGPRTRLRIAPARAGARRLVLETGSLDANITAAPGVFSVDTPSSRAVDLGCKYTLDVDRSGAGVLHVTLGWVALEWQGRVSLVPAGALCATRAVRGPGTPYFEGATPAFIDAVTMLDRGLDADRPAALSMIVREARPLDALTLWHFLTRLDRASNARIHDRLAELFPQATAADRDRVVAGEDEALARWWERIGLGDLEELRKGLAGARR